MRGFAVSQSAALRSTSLTTAPAFLIVSSSSLIFAIAFSRPFSQAASRSGARTAATRARFFKVGLLVDPPPCCSSTPPPILPHVGGREGSCTSAPRFGAGDSPYDSRGRSSRDRIISGRDQCQAGNYTVAGGPAATV